MHHGQQLASVIGRVEGRIVACIDDAVVGFNRVLQQGLGEVQAKCEVTLAPCCAEWSRARYGPKFPDKKLSKHFDLDDFKTTLLEFKCLQLKTVKNVLRDITRFFGC